MSGGTDPFLAIGLAILMFLMLIINVYTLVYWQHPEDKNESILPKILIVLGLQLTAVCVLMIPIGKKRKSMKNNLNFLNRCGE
jgi:LMBR1 domain-containing protein 1